ncbi:tRNA N(3)-methylcytidine methyltransferase METTL2-like isoform X2 [Portunus trituberculatus]|uniref:tRNA N(3)-methylcytidine methyltransferase METTL2-like isoform X2 n=1 Tax=Portunus trituberculatus TaxID=210409 RepID=UPI001E1CFFF7|nr:tRNA N(3)-methylcytidine methyltransferase METTL2-like isoform X2 [Portunus trituberculatus]
MREARYLSSLLGQIVRRQLRCARLYCDETKARKRPQGGGRELKDWKIVFSHNNWDNVVWDETQEAEAKAKVQVNSEVLLTTEEIEKLEQEAAGQWDAFYGIHQNRFFKDRNWLFTEFPELAPHLAHTFPQKQNPGDAACPPAPQSQNTALLSDGEVTESEKHRNILETSIERISPPPQSSESSNITDRTSLNSDPCESIAESPHTSQENNATDSFPGKDATLRILEVGCGVGNTVFPILKTNNKEGLFVYCCDFSSIAVDIVKESPDYDTKRCHAFVCDLSSEEWETPFPKGSLDIIVCIFVLSALHPDKYPQVISKMVEYLRPGGLILYRDYGRYDMAQLRFKKGRCLADNFYMRGDGTRCYFITQDEVRELMTQAGLEEVQNLVDRRLQVNRGKQLTMYRVWVQAKYRKPAHP